MRRLLVGVSVAAAGAAAWLVARGHTDPHAWPDAVKEEVALLKRNLQEALAAGKRAAARKEEEIDREIASAA